MPIHRLSDSRLIRRSQQGDRDAFVALVQRYDERLRGLTYSLVVGEESMRRVLRAAYLKAWRDVVRADPDDDAGAWLYRTVYNACIDELRRERPADGAAGAGSGSGSGSGSAESDPAFATLAALPPEQRVTVVLVDREGFSRTGAARILGIDDDTLEARLAAGRAQLRRVARPRGGPRGPRGGRRPRDRSSSVRPRPADAAPPPADPTAGADPAPSPADPAAGADATPPPADPAVGADAAPSSPDSAVGADAAPSSADSTVGADAGRSSADSAVGSPGDPAVGADAAPTRTAGAGQAPTPPGGLPR